MVGDRYLTDIVYGNQNGLLTIRPAPLTMKGDPSVVRLVSLPSLAYTCLERIVHNCPCIGHELRMGYNHQGPLASAGWQPDTEPKTPFSCVWVRWKWTGC